MTRGEQYILLCTLSNYYNFVIDEHGKLRRYLFDSNVRDFMGLNRVNEDIRETLSTSDSADFWCLNNGVTILANTASVTGNRSSWKVCRLSTAFKLRNRYTATFGTEETIQPTEQYS